MASSSGKAAVAASDGVNEKAYSGGEYQQQQRKPMKWRKT
jgi:hypothetical protein